MPFVTVEMWEGRTPEQKKELVKGIFAAFEKIGVKPSALHILLKDNPKSNWATNGKMASET